MSLLKFKKQQAETSLAVQWLRLCASNAGMQVESLVGQRRFHMPCHAVKKQKAVTKKIIQYCQDKLLTQPDVIRTAIKNST